MAIFFTARTEDKVSAHGWTGNIAERVEKGRDDKSLISFHYDLSNKFYSLFVHPEMVYSCAYYERDDMDLAQGQIAKLDLICCKLRLAPGERFLDIGCGWGRLICHATKHYRVRAHGVTLSREQYEWCLGKIARESLSDLVTVELRDYRTLDTPRLTTRSRRSRCSSMSVSTITTRISCRCTNYCERAGFTCIRRQHAWPRATSRDFARR